MKYLPLALLLSSSFLVSCSKTCTEDIPACTERPDTSTVCQAAFESWFYDETTGTCTSLAYSGCEELGFTSQEVCERCDCQ